MKFFLRLLIPITFCFIILYYLFFLTKGMVLYDEGYTVHLAERILQGQQPYRDFFLQYPPGFFYFMAGVYKLFGISLLIGRVITLLFCLGNIFLMYILVRKARDLPPLLIISIMLSLAAFGFPLINIPIVIWPCVFFTLLLMVVFQWENTLGHYFSCVIAGVILFALCATKQNIGLAMVVVWNSVMLFSHGLNKHTFRSLLVGNLIWILGTLLWVYYFFFYSHPFFTFRDFLAFNKRYLSLYHFSYPSLTLLFTPLGIMKLLPYYLPILFTIFLMYTVVKNKTTQKQALLGIFPLVGFFVTIFPTTDLLHVYPYLGLILSIFLLVLYQTRPAYSFISYLLICLTIISGFYLALFREYYRYQPPVRLQNTSVPVKRAAFITVDQQTKNDVLFLTRFMSTHTKQNDSIFIYPFSPLYYFLLNRPNATPYAILWPGYLTSQEELQTIQDLKHSNARYIITQGAYKFQTPLSEWIQKQKVVAHYNQFTIFLINKN